MHTLYDRLTVSRDAPLEVIRAAYRVLSQRHHPDRNPGDPSAAEAMQAINDAYAVLSDAQRRRAYDTWLSNRVSSTATPRETSSSSAGVRWESAQARQPAQSVSRSRWWAAALAALVVAPLIGGAGLWHASQREPPAVSGLPPSHVEWRIHGVDSEPRQVEARALAPGRVVGSAVQRARTHPLPPASYPAPSVDAPVHPSDPTVPQRPYPALPIVADPNGRPWPLGAAYVSGLPQANLDGLSAVLLDNERNPAPVFVTLVSIDGDRAEPVRHVHVPAMGAFRVESIRPGRYEVQHRNLVTGALTRSEVFELRQIDGRYGTRATERTVALDPWAAAMAPFAAGAF